MIRNRPGEQGSQNGKGLSGLTSLQVPVWLYWSSIRKLFGNIRLENHLYCGASRRLFLCVESLPHFRICSGKLRTGETPGSRGQEGKIAGRAFPFAPTSILGWNECLAVRRDRSCAHARLFFYVEHAKPRKAGDFAYECCRRQPRRVCDNRSGGDGCVDWGGVFVSQNGPPYARTMGLDCPYQRDYDRSSAKLLLKDGSSGDNFDALDCIEMRALLSDWIFAHLIQ